MIVKKKKGFFALQLKAINETYIDCQRKQLNRWKKIDAKYLNTAFQLTKAGLYIKFINLTTKMGYSNKIVFIVFIGDSARLMIYLKNFFFDFLSFDFFPISSIKLQSFSLIDFLFFGKFIARLTILLLSHYWFFYHGFLL